MFLPSLIKFAENGLNMIWKPGTSVAKIDDLYYDTTQLNPEERRRAMALLAEQTLPEGSIFVMDPGKEQKGFGVVPDPDEEKGKIASDFSKLAGRERGAKIAELFLANYKGADIDTVVLPGNASSPLGTAALGKTVANLYNRKVAAIVAGQGAFDLLMESTSGAMMTPMANALNAFNPLLERFATVNPLGATMYIGELVDAMHDAGTLYALLRARLIDKTFKDLNMIVCHSKGNWAVLAALLAFELELIDTAKRPETPIKIVTFGNPVDLPDMDDRMKEFFQYFQFAGECDKLAHNCSLKAWRLHFNGAEKLDPREPEFDCSAGRVEEMVASTEHHLVAHIDPATGEESQPFHMPIEKILPKIRPTAVM